MRNLSRAQERAIKKLAARVGRVTQADRSFFERRPDRQHRIRLASQAEIEQNAILLGKIHIPPSYQHFIAVKNIATSVRLRLTVIGSMHGETDLDEELARTIYELVNNDEARRIEADMRKFVGAGK